MNTKVKTRIAREFRKKPTESEKLIWDALRNRSFLNLKFRRQHVMDGYVIDFFCSELPVELYSFTHGPLRVILIDISSGGYPNLFERLFLPLRRAR